MRLRSILRLTVFLTSALFYSLAFSQDGWVPIAIQHGTISFETELSATPVTATIDTGEPFSRINQAFLDANPGTYRLGRIRQLGSGDDEIQVREIDGLRLKLSNAKLDLEDLLPDGDIGVEAGEPLSRRPLGRDAGVVDQRVQHAVVEARADLGDAALGVLDV